MKHWKSLKTILALNVSILFILTTGLTYGQEVLYVDHTASGSGNGSSWIHAFTTLQEALDVVNDVNNEPGTYEIWIAQGTYYPDEGPGRTNNDRSNSFRIEKDSVSLFGGFPNGGGNGTFAARNWHTFPVTLSGDIDQDMTLNGNSYHVLYLIPTIEKSMIISRSTVIDGFIISGGNADADEEDFPDFIGGGIYLHGQGEDTICSPTLLNLIITGNNAQYGGGIANNGTSNGNSSPLISNVVLYNNTAEFGGAIINGGINGGVSSPELINISVYGNEAQFGGGMLLFGSSPEDGEDGEDGTVEPVVVNSIFWGNNASTDGDEIFHFGGEAMISFSIIRGGCPMGATCSMNVFDVDPLFVDDMNGNLRLQEGSPAINAGNNSAIPSGITRDLATLPRIQSGIVDLGAYEAGSTSIPALSDWGIFILLLLFLVLALIKIRQKISLSSGQDGVQN